MTTSTPTEMTDSQLIMTIRQIESSPRGHQPFSILKQIDEHLAELRDEAYRRGLNV